MMILPPGLMSDKDMQLLRDNGICVVTAEDPARVKFVDPIPVVSSRTQVENAAIQLSRHVLGGIGRCSITNGTQSRVDILRQYIDLLVAGTPLDPNPPREQIEKEIFNTEKAAEIRKIAREEARAERQAKKEADARRLADTAPGQDGVDR
jgi:hypothetical protein